MTDEQQPAEAQQRHSPLYWGMVGLAMAGAFYACVHAATNHAFFKSENSQNKSYSPAPNTIEERAHDGYRLIFQETNE